MTKNRAVLELIFAGGLWGFGFVATIWALQEYTFSEVLLYRFILALLAGEILYYFIHGRKFQLPGRREVILSFGAGVLLSTLLILQTIGLKSTSASKSGFITSLYVILVPLINHLFLRKPTSLKFYGFVFLALVGAGLLLNVESSEGLNPGDLWTLACSLAAALHILYIGRISHDIPDSFRFNNLQSLWCLLLLLPFVGSQSHLHFHLGGLWPWIGIISLGIGSSAIGFYIQIRAQKVLSPTTASMLFLLESPFALLFGFCLLGERLGPRQMGGALLIMLASYLTVREESRWAVQTSPTREKKLE